VLDHDHLAHAASPLWSFADVVGLTMYTNDGPPDRQKLIGQGATEVTRDHDGQDRCTSKADSNGDSNTDRHSWMITDPRGRGDVGRSLIT
jgi:hypothetical protein